MVKGVVDALLILHKESHKIWPTAVVLLFLHFPLVIPSLGFLITATNLSIRSILYILSGSILTSRNKNTHNTHFRSFHPPTIRPSLQK